MNKVYGGTPNLSGENRCLSCRNAHIRRGITDSSESIFCGVDRQNMCHKIVECNHYDDKSHPSRWDMEQIAWVLVTNKAGKAIGFVSAADARKKAAAGFDD